MEILVIVKTVIHLCDSRTEILKVYFCQFNTPKSLVHNTDACAGEDSGADVDADTNIKKTSDTDAKKENLNTDDKKGKFPFVLR